MGQVLNLQNLAQDLGISHATAGRWLTILQASYVVYLVQPYYWRTTKRLIKSPKLYFYDVGLARWLNGIESPRTFKGVRHLAKVVVPPPGKPPNGGGLIYGGADTWDHAGTQVVGFERLDALLVACGRIVDGASATEQRSEICGNY